MFVVGLDYLDLDLDENRSFAENVDYESSSKTDFDDDISSDIMDYSEDDTVSTVKRQTDKRVSKLNAYGNFTSLIALVFISHRSYQQCFTSGTGTNNLFQRKEMNL